MADLVIDDPYHLSEAVRRPLATADDVEASLARAREAARSWADTTPETRAQLCRRALDIMLQRQDGIAADITRMMGKPLAQAKGEVKGMVARANHMIAIAADSLADTVLPERAGYERRIQRVPLGVVFNMPAWNYPLLTCVNAVVPAVLAGNAVVLKHSTRTALCGEHFADAFSEAGAPAGLFQALHCDHATAAAISQDRRIGYVAFTGSVGGGHAVYCAIATSHFIDAGLELGGNDAAYIAEDADLARAIEGVVDGACYNAGQSCCGVERVYVHEKHHDAVVDGCKALLEKYVLGDPTDDATSMGPMAQANACDFLAGQVTDATSKGAAILCGGRAIKVEGKGRFFQPTLLAKVSHAMAVMREESFGPLLPIMSVKSDEEALALMNDSDLGLTASLWTSDRDRAALLAAKLEVGTVFMNQCDTLDPALPWTGVKDSGKGSTLSSLGFLHLTRPRSINFRL